MKKTARRLTMNKETLRHLSRLALGNVRGGETSVDVCASVYTEEGWPTCAGVSCGDLMCRKYTLDPDARACA